MIALPELLPGAQFSEHHERRIAAEPAAVWRALHELRLGESLLTRVLMGVRALPALLTGAEAPGMGGGRFLEHGPVPVLGEERPRLIVAGGVMQPWRLRGGDTPPQLDAEQLRDFSDAGWVKAGMDFVLEPDGTGTRLRTSTLVEATDEATRVRFGCYWLVIRLGSGLIRRELLRLVARGAERPAA